MSDEQWLWLFINQRIDADEKLEKMCSKCREEVTSSHKCIRCGQDITESESFVNPSFDMDRYNLLAGHVEELYKDDEEDDDENNILSAIEESDQYDEDL